MVMILLPILERLKLHGILIEARKNRDYPLIFHLFLIDLLVKNGS